MGNPAVRIVTDSDPTRRAGALVAAALEVKARRRGMPRLAVSGGSSVAALHIMRTILAAGWNRVALTWVDERCVPFDHIQSNRGALYRAGVLDSASPPALEVPLWLDEEGPEAAIVRVGREWHDAFDAGLDVLLLGMGEDGHVASLFPGQRWPDGVVGFIDDSPKPPPARMTLSVASLATASETILFACGESKRRAIQRLARGDRALPACGLPGLIVVTDLDLGDSM